MPRFSIQPSTSSEVFLEEEIPEQVLEELKVLGHEVQLVKGASRSMFGRGNYCQSGK